MTISVFPKHPKKTNAPPIVSRVWHANNSQQKTKSISQMQIMVQAMKKWKGKYSKK
jgi:hypothetical protein